MQIRTNFFIPDLIKLYQNAQNDPNNSEFALAYQNALEGMNARFSAIFDKQLYMSMYTEGAITAEHVDNMEVPDREVLYNKILEIQKANDELATKGG